MSEKQKAVTLHSNREAIEYVSAQLWLSIKTKLEFCENNGISIGKEDEFSTIHGGNIAIYQRTYEDFEKVKQMSVSMVQKMETLLKNKIENFTHSQTIISHTNGNIFQNVLFNGSLLVHIIGFIHWPDWIKGIRLACKQIFSSIAHPQLYFDYKGWIDVIALLNANSKNSHSINTIFSFFMNATSLRLMQTTNFVKQNMNLYRKFIQLFANSKYLQYIVYRNGASLITNNIHFQTKTLYIFAKGHVRDEIQWFHQKMTFTNLKLIQIEARTFKMISFLNNFITNTTSSIARINIITNVPKKNMLTHDGEDLTISHEIGILPLEILEVFQQEDVASVTCRMRNFLMEAFIISMTVSSIKYIFSHFIGFFLPNILTDGGITKAKDCLDYLGVSHVYFYELLTTRLRQSFLNLSRLSLDLSITTQTMKNYLTEIIRFKPSTPCLTKLSLVDKPLNKTIDPSIYSRLFNTIELQNIQYFKLLLNEFRLDNLDEFKVILVQHLQRMVNLKTCFLCFFNLDHENTMKKIDFQLFVDIYKKMILEGIQTTILISCKDENNEYNIGNFDLQDKIAVSNKQFKIIYFGEKASQQIGKSERLVRMPFYKMKTNFHWRFEIED